jgi:hypothetical protein
MKVNYLSKFCCILIIACLIYSLLSVKITVDHCEPGAISILYQLLKSSFNKSSFVNRCLFDFI